MGEPDVPHGIFQREALWNRNRFFLFQCSRTIKLESLWNGCMSTKNKPVKSSQKRSTGIIDVYLTRIFHPAMMRFGFLINDEFSFWIFATVVPYFLAIAESVSPLLTV